MLLMVLANDTTTVLPNGLQQFTRLRQATQRQQSKTKIVFGNQCVGMQIAQ
jgi:hypothetical protein